MKLKPCPFCGNPPTIRQVTASEWVIKCTNIECKLLIETFRRETVQNAASLWNTRAEEPAEKTAHWDINTDGFYPFCSHCGEAAQHMTPHCPNCGYRMTTRRHEE